MPAGLGRTGYAIRRCRRLHHSSASSRAPCAYSQDIGRAFWEQQAAKRERKQRLVQIGGHAVLKSNLYDMNQVRVAGK